MLLTWEIVPDLLANQKRVLQAVDGHSEHGTCLFNPDEYKRQAAQMTKAAHRLSDEELRQYARIATEVRASLRLRAAGLGQPEEEEKLNGTMPSGSRSSKRKRS
jgi:hypothetical protein